MVAAATPAPMKMTPRPKKSLETDSFSVDERRDASVKARPGIGARNAVGTFATGLDEKNPEFFVLGRCLVLFSPLSFFSHDRDLPLPGFEFHDGFR